MARKSARQRRIRTLLYDRNNSSGSPSDTTPQPLRVVYVNVNGLQPLTWRMIQGWLDTGTFDLVFIAETWYVGWKRYRSSKYTIAVTDPPPPTMNPGRPSGGLALFGTLDVRGKVGNIVSVTETAITVLIGPVRISGLYLCPTLSDTELETTLEAACLSDMILGDFNFRFETRTPPKRYRAVADWMQRADLVHVRPIAERSCLPRCLIRCLQDPVLTTDHCFVRLRGGRDTLHLLNNKDLGLRTDHQYTLCLSLGDQSNTGAATPTTPQYRVGRLSSTSVQHRLCKEWDVVAEPSLDFLLDTSNPSVEIYEAFLSLYRRTCETVLGRREDSSPSNVERSLDVVDDRTPAGTDLLVKRAFANDRDNGPLLPSVPGRDALEEAVVMLEARYTAPGQRRRRRARSTRRPSYETTIPPFSTEEVIAELKRQDGDKAYGMDGVHMRVLKALQDTTLTPILTSLFNACLLQQTTPSAWNRTDIYLLQKDPKLPKTAENTRPVTIVSVIRKVFECLLLRRIEDLPFARLHPTQAGFRAGYSTTTNAALLHLLLERRLIEGVVFLDFRAAFDVLDHTILRRVLSERGCLPDVLKLIDGLCFDSLSSRVVANRKASAYFPRTRGVVQGSPLSPLLFNIFVDRLLIELNEGTTDIPRALFYADDGTILLPPGCDPRALVSQVVRWSTANGLQLNVRKCGFLTRQEGVEPLYIAGEVIPKIERYTYLGFPVTIDGIDFAGFLTGRLDSALARMGFLDIYVSSIGPAHRLQVYRRYLAPMFEYGAPLLWTWHQSQTEQVRLAWIDVMKKWDYLVGWIAGGRFAPRVTANLLGLSPLLKRFEVLHATYWWTLERAASDNPLRLFLTFRPWADSFTSRLRSNTLYQRWKIEGKGPSFPSKASLQSFLRQHLTSSLRTTAKRGHLTRLIPFESRLTSRYRGADHILDLPLVQQELLLQYRRGIWCFGRQHRCRWRDGRFQRGHEECECFGLSFRLSRKQRRAFDSSLEGSRTGGRVTEIDWLLNHRFFDQAYCRLRLVQSTLEASYAETLT